MPGKDSVETFLPDDFANSIRFKGMDHSTYSFFDWTLVTDPQRDDGEAILDDEL
jgi:hypothetical protein